MKIKKFLSELLGTFLLVFLGTTAYALLGSTGLGSTYSTVAGIIGIAVVFGLAMTFVYICSLLFQEHMSIQQCLLQCILMELSLS